MGHRDGSITSGDVGCWGKSACLLTQGHDIPADSDPLAGPATTAPRRMMPAMEDLLLRRAPAAPGEVYDILSGSRIVGRILLSAYYRSFHRHSTAPKNRVDDRFNGSKESKSSRREAGRSAGPAGHQSRVYHQPEDCQGARPHHSAAADRPRRRGDRISWRACTNIAALAYGRSWHFSAVPTAPSDVRFQGVSSIGQCNTSCSLLAGVSKAKVFRGR